jgi:hypothetical protein
MKKKTIINAILRGALKTMPGVGAGIELVKNVKHELRYGETKPLPHNYTSITVQLVGVACIVYAFVTKLITIQDVLTLLGWTQ